MANETLRDPEKPRPFCYCTVIGGTVLLLAAFGAKAWFREGWFSEFHKESRRSLVRVPTWYFPGWLFKNHPLGCVLLVGLAVLMIAIGWVMSRRIRRLERPNSSEIALGVFVLAVAFALKGLVW